MQGAVVECGPPVWEIGNLVPGLVLGIKMIEQGLVGSVSGPYDRVGCQAMVLAVWSPSGAVL